jgi:hypothetical protein
MSVPMRVIHIDNDRANNKRLRAFIILGCTGTAANGNDIGNGIGIGNDVNGKAATPMVSLLLVIARGLIATKCLSLLGDDEPVSGTATVPTDPTLTRIVVMPLPTSLLPLLAVYVGIGFVVEIGTGIGIEAAANDDVALISGLV